MKTQSWSHLGVEPAFSRVRGWFVTLQSVLASIRSLNTGLVLVGSGHANSRGSSVIPQASRDWSPCRALCGGIGCRGSS